MKYRIVLKTKTKKDNDLIVKFNVAPSKLQGLSNFLKIALDPDNKNEVSFTVEKIGADKKSVESSVFGEFRFQQKEKEKESGDKI
jgi:hypothetical protein